MVDTYRRMVAGFLLLERHSNTKSRTVLGVAGNDSNRNTRQLSVKTSQSAFQARKVFVAKAPCAIDAQSANRVATEDSFGNTASGWFKSSMRFTYAIP
jgi:hypothetical protein